MRFVAAVVALVTCVHAGLWFFGKGEKSAPEVDEFIASMSYTPFEGVTHPDQGGYKPSLAQIRTDLKSLTPYTRAVRTYSSTAGSDLIPQVAAEFGLKTTIGAWIDKNGDRSAREIARVVELAKRHSNVNGIVVGNETIYRGELVLIGDDKLDAEEERKLAGANEDEKEAVRVARLIRVIQRVKRDTNGAVPVTTGEIHSVWLKHPELASAVDFIAAHVLPYWEGVPASTAVDQAVLIYNRLRDAYPGKKIVIAEFGWPSAGYNRQGAEPGRAEQAAIIREFVRRADALGIDYNIIEAFDQPWKTFEGSVGPYWGLFNTKREPKFAFAGPIVDAEHWKIAGVALLVGLLLSLPILTVAQATLGQILLLSGAAHAVGAWTATIFAYWNGHYFVPGATFALALGLLLLVPLVIIAFNRIDEIASVVFGRAPRRLLPSSGGAASATLAPAGNAPKVSIHIPAYREPPEMLKATLDSVARLDYANFECVVVINNTPDPAFWQPIEEHCRELGERFKFVRADRLEGYKAGALRLALANAADDAEIIGIIDADYVIDRDWLKDLAPVFADPGVGLIQAPQDHRDATRSPMHDAMNAEYAGFFDIGMVQRNEANAIIVHGTMCLVRRTALDAAGGWSSDTICEDTDLGLTILEDGWQAHYTRRRYGHGLLPDTFDAFKKQRDRWASGGFQIVKKHWRRMLPGESRLTTDQRREFALGWMSWLGAEAVGVLVAMFNIVWVPIIAFVGIAVPDKVLTLPILAAFVVSIAHFVALYRARVGVSTGQMSAAMFAAMSMQWTVARAVGVTLFKDHLSFVRTAKGGRTRKGAAFPAFYEAIFAGLLVGGALIVYLRNFENVREINLFAAVLVVQSLPFLAAVAFAALDGSAINDFAFWRRIEARIGELIPRRGAMTRVTEGSTAPAENRIEVAQ